MHRQLGSRLRSYFLAGVLVTAFRFNQLARLALVFGRGQG